MQYALPFSFLGTFYRCPLAAPLASDAQNPPDDGAIGDERCDGCAVGVSKMIINMSHGERTGRERGKRAGLPHLCLDVGETGWSVWAAGTWYLRVGKESTSQEPASTKFLCDCFFLELFPEIEMSLLVFIKEMFTWL